MSKRQKLNLAQLLLKLLHDTSLLQCLYTIYTYKIMRKNYVAVEIHS